MVYWDVRPVIIDMQISAVRIISWCLFNDALSITSLKLREVGMVTRTYQPYRIENQILLKLQPLYNLYISIQQIYYPIGDIRTEIYKYIYTICVAIKSNKNDIFYNICNKNDREFSRCQKELYTSLSILYWFCWIFSYIIVHFRMTA